VSVADLVEEHMDTLMLENGKLMDTLKDERNRNEDLQRRLNNAKNNLQEKVNQLNAMATQLCASDKEVCDAKVSRSHHLPSHTS
jgi:flagellar capping protein FliD